VRVFHIGPDGFRELTALPERCPSAASCGWATGAASSRSASPVQQALRALGLRQLVDLHVSDLLNNQLPSHFDYTSWYDLLVFRRLAAAPGSQDRSSTTSTARWLGPARAARHRHQPGGLRGLRPRAGDGAPDRLPGARVLRPALAA
jgi:hypothetical protein